MCMLLGVELRALPMLSKHSATKLHPGSEITIFYLSFNLPHILHAAQFGQFLVIQY